MRKLYLDKTVKTHAEGHRATRWDKPSPHHQQKAGPSAGLKRSSSLTRDAQDVGVEGAPLSSNGRQRSFGNLGKAYTAPCLTPGLTHQPRSTACLRVMVPEELEAEPGVHEVAKFMA